MGKGIRWRVGPQQFRLTPLVNCADDVVVEEDVVEAEFFDGKTDVANGIGAAAPGCTRYRLPTRMTRR